MIVQDDAEDPDRGIAVLIDMKSYYTKYNFGQLINLNDCLNQKLLKLFK